MAETPLRRQYLDIKSKDPDTIVFVRLGDFNETFDGDAESVGEVNDVWTFARDTRSRDPNWKLIATEADA